MAFTKHYKVITDSPIGYQLINGIAANAAELRTQMFVEHGQVEPLARAAQGLDYHRLGRHDLPEVPRAVGYAAIRLATITTLGIGFQWTGPGIPYVTKLATGAYEVTVVGLSTFWAKVTPSLGGVFPLLEPRVRPFYAGTLSPSGFKNTTSGLRINTFADVGAGFIAFDMNFAIALYGEP